MGMGLVPRPKRRAVVTTELRIQFDPLQRGNTRLRVEAAAAAAVAVADVAAEEWGEVAAAAAAAV